MQDLTVLPQNVFLNNIAERKQLYFSFLYHSTTVKQFKTTTQVNINAASVYEFLGVNIGLISLV